MDKQETGEGAAEVAEVWEARGSQGKVLGRGVRGQICHVAREPCEQGGGS